MTSALTTSGTSTRQRSVLRDPAARFITVTAALGSFTDWTLFAVLVATVDAATNGSAWATALVLVAKILPATLFAPIAARRVDGRPLRPTLLGHEAVRAGAVALTAAGVATSSVAVSLAGVVLFEYGAAMLAASRESFISRFVPRRHFTRVNTITAVLGYGLLPVGAFVVHGIGLDAGWILAGAGYAVLAATYARGIPDGRNGEQAVEPGRDESRASRHGRASLRRTVLTAGLALMPVVMLFNVAPRAAEAWLGDPTRTGAITTAALAGGILGFVAANRSWRPESGLVVAGLGLYVASSGPWWLGLGGVGFGAGVAYLGLQTRLQHLASDPSQFARAFAVLKVCAVVATVSGPAVFGLAGLDGVLLAGTALAGTSLLVVTTVGRRLRDVPAATLRWCVQQLVVTVVRVTVRVRVEGERRPGPAVVVSNHPNALDGVLALLTDRTLRPIARWQKNLIARAGIWIADSVVTTARTDRSHRPAFAEAIAHLHEGGRIWLAPEGGAQPSTSLQAPRSGAVRMAHDAGVPIQPLGITYDRHPGPRLRAWRPWRRPAVTLRWGAPYRTCGIIDVDNEQMMRRLAAASGMNWEPRCLAAA